MLTCKTWRRSVHCTKAEPNPTVIRSAVVVLSSLPRFVFPNALEAGPLNGVVRARQREARTFLVPAAFVAWLATPTWTARLGPAHNRLPLLPASQTWYRHDALHCMNHCTAIVPHFTGLLLEQVHERVIEAPQQAPVRGGYASLLLLSHCFGSSDCCFCCCCRC